MTIKRVGASDPPLDLPNLDKVISQAYKDNEAALILANSTVPKMTPRSKHIGVKYHWFRDNLRPLKILIVEIGTTQYHLLHVILSNRRLFHLLY